jgi:acetyltransferase-like isoleucine patch superfamily enzyme
VTSSHPAGVDPTARIAPTSIIGNPSRPLLDGREVESEGRTVIGPGVWIGHFSTIGPGVTIGARSIVEDYVNIQANAVLGNGVLVTSKAWLGIGASVGDDCIIKGHVGDNVRVGAGCRIAGELIHRQLDPSIPWDDPVDEASPIVADGAFVGWRAVVIGGVNIGEGAYVCAGALVTKDVPAGYIACGRNEFMPPSDWPGTLGKSPFFAARKPELATAPVKQRMLTDLPLRPPPSWRSWARRSAGRARS